MHSEDKSDDRLEAQLEELAQYATRSAFSQLYFRLLLTWAREVRQGGAYMARRPAQRDAGCQGLNVFRDIMLSLLTSHL